MESKDAFYIRIRELERYNLADRTQDLRTNVKLKDKVRDNGSFCPFYGDTVSFLLEDKIRCRLKEVQQILYASAPGVLAEPLREETFHMTLHDLTSGTERGRIKEKTQSNENKVRRIFRSLEGEHPKNIQMISSYLFNMVNSSLVWILLPWGKEDYQELMELYQRFQEIAALDYPFTPHITLAYYRPGSYSGRQLESLALMMQELNKERLYINLNLNSLVYCTFSDMNHYRICQRLL
ncbi:hypothetical protein [Lactonifactor longoviformis]|uniref:hypothetical protein n=1 Tax=Lactonifactor longoviformis TaxID=341220 RepID=UPI0036F1F936